MYVCMYVCVMQYHFMVHVYAYIYIYVLYYSLFKAPKCAKPFQAQGEDEACARLVLGLDTLETKCIEI